MFFVRIPVSLDGINCPALIARTQLSLRLEAYDINVLAVRLLELIGIPSSSSTGALSGYLIHIVSCIAAINICYGSDFAPAAFHLNKYSFDSVFACLR